MSLSVDAILIMLLCAAWGMQSRASDAARQPCPCCPHDPKPTTTWRDVGLLLAALGFLASCLWYLI